MNQSSASIAANLFVVLISILIAPAAYAGTGDSVCYPLFEKAGAVPETPSCELSAPMADASLSNRYCTSDPSYATRYCGDACYANVVALDKLSQPTEAPQNGFIVNQTCIAKTSCLSKTNLDKPAWLDTVVTRFVTPFTTRSGDWNTVIASCDNFPSTIAYVKRKVCEARMARYHISHDLQSALNTTGCGTVNDWNRIGAIISNCVDQANNAVAGAFASGVVQYLRDNVRSLCVDYRQSHNLPVEG